MNHSKIRIGVAGWSYPDWRGIVYPDAKTDMLSYVAQFVDLIEINSTFYRPALSRDSQIWLQRTASMPDFFFTAKLHQDFTHSGVFEDSFVREFKDGLAPLLEAHKLKQLLAQFRFDFDDTAENRLRIEKIYGTFSGLCPLALEFRHRSWQEPPAIEFLSDLRVSICSLDYPVGPESFNPDKPLLTGPHGYFRMHGRNADKWFSRSSRDEMYNYFYKPDELEEILRKVERLAQHCESCVVIANNHYKGAELANAIQLRAMLTGHKQRFPEGLLVQYPDLIEYAENAILF